jgi:RNA polymerase sigma-70 factor (ECF subfamily)
MAGQAILGETVLKLAIPTETAETTVEALVASHAGMVFRIAYSILRNHHDAEDAAQECFLRVVKHRGRLHKIRNPKTWLARVAWTTALDKRRTSQPSASLDDEAFGEPMLDVLPDPAPGADLELAGRQMQRLLQRLIAALPDELRQPLELSTVQELNSAEIAEVMKIPEGSVRTRLFRARKLLKEKMASQLEAKHAGPE